MKLKLSVVAVLGAATLIGGCTSGINLQDYATTPNAVQTAQGTVTCQHYRYDQILWDEAISAPTGMSIETADQICKNEGFRIIEEGTINAAG